jgi:hypothetical protein
MQTQPSPRRSSFDPNTLGATKRPEWATYIQDRRPHFKTHSDRGKALQAASYYSRPTQIFRYNFEDEKWIEVFNGVVPKYGRGERPQTCERCGGSTIREKPYERRGRDGSWEKGVRVTNDGRYGWLAEPNNKKKLVEPFKRAWLCVSCR